MRRRLRARDEGMTLIELLVSMGIFTVVLAVFFGGLITMTRSTSRAQDITAAGDSVRRAFQTMDRQIRYASAVNLPGVGASGAHYVEFRTEAQPNGLAPLCTQWRVDPTNRVLQQRTWRETPSATRSSWSTVATEIRNDLTTHPPFTLYPVGGGRSRQQLAVSLDAGLGEGGDDAQPGADISTVFVARNSGAASTETSVCTNLLERP
ncbi:prepilin-type N-terminal cleavage/methylation domain-containing protein [Actinotalea sp. BY-33]|uniref:Prepilin-type N-terminal cleavage/methylation domain-containing protein n=1 Tax=Actinotalea soli TaxID=2819234 RepID=A0A939LNE3_9CELL|nr:prepilin-type N-terminal cleavage/methylation domain-containing protein [Actinotalea soli]MBO1750453.1 prepilin-type N-terminal cleavage/methylation domain-containing protein [Actinotalea soli]